MQGVREIKRRIKGINETRKITRAMKLISAAKLKKARQQLEMALPYFRRVKAVMADILVHSQNIENIYFQPAASRDSQPKRGYIVLSGDKGLAGGYNSNIFKLTEKELEKDKEAHLYVAGQVGRTYFSKRNYNYVPEFDYPVQNPSIYRARDIAEDILKLFLNKDLDEVYVIYTLAISALKLQPRVMKILPIDIGELESELAAEGYKGFVSEKGDESMVYEPSSQVVFNILIPKYLKGVIYGALVEAYTSEQSARMTSMDNATANAEDMLARLNLIYNRTRQAGITREISEIVGGASAMS